ncbi:lytic transglycosylase domain-containing protein [Tistrella bauzanensis]
MKRRPGSEARPQRPERPEDEIVTTVAATRQPSTVDRLDTYSAADRLKGAAARRARALEAQISALIRKGRGDDAEKLLASGEVKKLFDRPALDQARIRVAMLHLVEGRTQRAYDLAGPAADRSAAIAPYGHWIAGLSAWKLDQPEIARRHFELFARTSGLSAWNEAAGAFWAARANLSIGAFDEAQGWLDRAARQPLTFYGQIARALLGAPTSDLWQPRLAGDGVTPISAATSCRARGPTGLALAEIGEYDRAANEVELIAAAAGPAEASAVIELAERVNAPEAATVIGRKAAAASGMPDVTSIFPVPDYRPRGGFSVDRALLYALARKESNFNPQAVSPAGARGLMQLMPGTAQLVARSLGLGGGLSLNHPDINLQLGQAYLRRLMDEGHIGNNLVNVLAAYNAGPGNLRRWQDARGIDQETDPLFFIETIPVPETRDFLEQVLTNLWIYRSRLGQTSPSLAALAEGDWPSYETIDGNVSRDNAAIASGR